MVWYRLRKVKGKVYLIKEWYDPRERRKKSRSLGNVEEIERIVELWRSGRWCGGWDLNPRRPTPSGPEPDPFDLARAPPHH